MTAQRLPTMIFAALYLWFVTCEAGTHDVVYNEDQLTGSCSQTCNNLPVVYNKFNCDTITGCRYKHTGWKSWFVDCDWCICDCNTQIEWPEEESSHQASFNEADLWSSCSTMCDAAGLQRTGISGCSEVRDCVHEADGYMNGWYSCDYCECNCILKRSTVSQRIENVNFDLDSLNLFPGEVIALQTVEIENNRDTVRTGSTTLTVSYTIEKTWSSTESITVGVAIEISAEAVVVGSTVTLSTEASYAYQWGETSTSSVSTTVQAYYNVPPHGTETIVVMAEKYVIDIPYTADLVTVYSDGVEKIQFISGVYNEASASKFRTIYNR